MSIAQWWGGTSIGCSVWNAKLLLSAVKRGPGSNTW